MLGYEGQTSFNHAFRRWTGHSPLAARRAEKLSELCSLAGFNTTPSTNVLILLLVIMIRLNSSVVTVAIDFLRLPPATVNRRSKRPVRTVEDRFRCREGTVGRAFVDEDKDFGEAFNGNLRRRCAGSGRTTTHAP